MALTKIRDARKLVDFIENDTTFELIPSNFCPYHNHIAALFTDIVLQAGLNYKNIVAPRVKRVFNNYPDCETVQEFYDLILEEGLEDIILWKNDVKLNRIYDLIQFCFSNQINTSQELKRYLLNPENKSSFLNIKGFGNKTYDYLLKLLNVDTIAVDRHIFSFLDKAGIFTKDYTYTKNVVETAADLMDISRRSIDYSIWSYMAYENKKNSPQAILEFN
jgi:endonuclease III